MEDWRMENGPLAKPPALENLIGWIRFRWDLKKGG